MEALGLAEHAHAFLYSSHLPRVFGRSHRSYTCMAETEKSAESDGGRSSAVGDADRPAARVAQQLNVILPFLLPSAREDNLAPPAPLDTAALHCSS